MNTKSKSDWVKVGVGVGLNFLASLSPEQAGTLAWNIFSTPRTAKRLVHDSELLATAETSVLSWHGLPIYYYRWPAEGPVVLLAHGWESNASRWRPLIESLRAAGYAVLAPDAPAHGASGGKYFHAGMYAEVLKELLQKHPASIWMGHSAGGMAAVYLAYQYPELAPERLALLGVPSDLESLLTYYQRTIGLNEVAMNAMKAQFKRTFNTAASDFSIPRFLKELPTRRGLIVHDHGDDVAPVAGAYDMHASWKSSRLLLTEGLGHSLKSDAVNQSVLDWLGEPV